MANFNEGSLNMNMTTSAGVQILYQPVLNRHLLATVKNNAVHHQFGQKAPIPKGKGKTIAWDKMSPLPKAKTPLAEGITPTGTAINISRVTAEPKQYGAYIAITDQMDYFTPNPDPQVLQYNERLGENASDTLDSLTADILSSGTNVQYPNDRTSRDSLTKDDVITVDEIRKAVRTLKGNKGKPIGKDYVCIIHTDVAHDLMSDTAWQNVHTYSDTTQLYNGEIGRLYGVRFVETPDAVVFRGGKLAGYDELLIYSISEDRKTVTVAEGLAEAVSGDVIINGFTYTVSSSTTGDSGKATLTFSGTLDASIGADAKIYAAGGAADGRAVYSTLVIAKDSYGVSDPKSTLQNITKPLGSAGTADPLDQRSTMGWKSYHVAKVLAPEWLVRIESVSTR